MGYSEDALALRTPRTVALSRLERRLTFLFLDKARIEQGRTAVEAWHRDDLDRPVRTAIPVATLAVLALGPGTSITTPALTTLTRSGTCVIITDGAGMSAHTAVRPLTRSGKWAHAQATLWADPERRVQVAHAMYTARFDEDVPAHISISDLRGIEGQRVRAAYQHFAGMYKIRDFRRNSTDPTDAVNQNLNLSNAILYGCAAAVCHALALSPALGFIHHGRPNSFLYDLADLYKLRTSVPASFEAAAHRKPVSPVLRARLHDQHIIRTMVDDTLRLLTPGLPADEDGDKLIDDDGAATAEGLRNYGWEHDA